jgi:hypothetical protein
MTGSLFSLVETISLDSHRLPGSSRLRSHHFRQEMHPADNFWHNNKQQQQQNGPNPYEHSPGSRNGLNFFKSCVKNKNFWFFKLIQDSLIATLRSAFSQKKIQKKKFKKKIQKKKFKKKIHKKNLIFFFFWKIKKKMPKSYTCNRGSACEKLGGLGPLV